MGFHLKDLIKLFAIFSKGHIWGATNFCFLCGWLLLYIRSHYFKLLLIRGDCAGGYP